MKPSQAVEPAAIPLCYKDADMELQLLNYGP